jgi:quercetin dioxygenase-like cupin family protein
MKTLNRLLLIIGFCLGFSGLKAQDFVKQDPSLAKMLVDTAIVRAYEVTLAPAQRTKVHSHPAKIFYALTECKLNFHFDDGSTKEMDLEPGNTGFTNPSRPHWVENTGTDIAKWLEVELKEHPYKKSPVKPAKKIVPVKKVVKRAPVKKHHR